jgi:hypothetical protein
LLSLLTRWKVQEPQMSRNISATPPTTPPTTWKW